MGGHALKRTKTRRLPAAEYEAVRATVLARLAEETGSIARAETPYEVPGKADFGDLDVLYLPAAESTEDITDTVRRVFNATEVVRNGPVVSFDFEGYFQVDMIRCESPAAWDGHMAYLSYGDVGNIVGLLASVNGLKYGHRGLWVTVKIQEDSKKWTEATVILASHPSEIFPFLGLDYDRWLAGFRDREEIFEWLARSPFLHGDLYDPERLNKKERQHMRRPFQIAFSEYMVARRESHPSDRATISPDDAVVHFGKQEEVEAARREVERKRARARKFNGRLFLSLGQRAVTEHMMRFKHSVVEDKGVTEVDEAFDRWVEESEPEEIDRRVQLYIQEMKMKEEGTIREAKP